MKRKFPRIIFFINGSTPSDEDYDNAQEYGMNVVFRNAALVSNEGSLEECDGVAGEVPERYKDHASAEEALQRFAQSFRRPKFEEFAPDASVTSALPGEVVDAAKGEGKLTPLKAVTSDSPKPPAPKEAPEWKPNA